MFIKPKHFIIIFMVNCCYLNVTPVNKYAVNSDRKEIMHMFKSSECSELSAY